jgi:pyruvate/2-oxoacid:ferredoxin oxidoreductase beta subunit/Pyruvate/2-oxoacid:ferredoxin oxidoreductase gamma subunit
MTETPVQPPAAQSLRNERLYPFCPGCGHGPILDQLDKALGILGLNPSDVVLVSDIGCSGLSDQFFTTHGFHGLHGRSITYATGIKLARPELRVVVIMGDGGTGIGGAHLLNAARRNIGITVLVFNNFNFGMTGGQHSVTTPVGATTSTTVGGNLERPLDICGTVATNGAGYVYRGTSFDADLPERIAEAIDHPGFALADIWELCTAYYVPRNRLNRSSLYALLEELNFGTGVIARHDGAEYATAYREQAAQVEGGDVLPRVGLETRFSSSLDRPFRITLAGSAGAKVRSAAKLAGQAAILSGLWAAQRDDYPITVQSGHSVSELILSPEPIDYTGIRHPDALLILSDDGLAKSRGYLARMSETDRVFVLPAFAGLDTKARVKLIDPASGSERVPKKALALFAVAAMLRELDLFPQAALEAVAEMGPAAYATENLQAIGAAAAR